MKKRVLKLGTQCRDKATGLEGTLTHWVMDMSGNVEYVFQPRGLNEESQPLKKMYACTERLIVQDSDFEDIEVPFEILGSQVTDKASGFAGMAVEFIRHTNGCFHVLIQPAGVLPNKRTPINAHEFDLRQCTGEKIVELPPKELQKSRAETPSPSDVPERLSPGTYTEDGRRVPD